MLRDLLSFSALRFRSVGQPASQPVRQSVSQSVSQPASQPVRQSVSQPASQPVILFWRNLTEISAGK